MTDPRPTDHSDPFLVMSVPAVPAEPVGGWPSERAEALALACELNRRQLIAALPAGLTVAFMRDRLAHAIDHLERELAAPTEEDPSRHTCRPDKLRAGGGHLCSRCHRVFH